MMEWNRCHTEVVQGPPDAPIEGHTPGNSAIEDSVKGCLLAPLAPAERPLSLLAFYLSRLFHLFKRPEDLTDRPGVAVVVIDQPLYRL